MASDFDFYEGRADVKARDEWLVANYPQIEEALGVEISNTWGQVRLRSHCGVRANMYIRYEGQVGDVKTYKSQKGKTRTLKEVQVGGHTVALTALYSDFSSVVHYTLVIPPALEFASEEA